MVLKLTSADLLGLDSHQIGTLLVRKSKFSTKSSVRASSIMIYSIFAHRAIDSQYLLGELRLIFCVWRTKIANFYTAPILPFPPSLGYEACIDD